MIDLVRRILGFVCLSFFCTAVYSQALTNSPYSRYGIGMPENTSGFAETYSMGGLGAAIQNDTISPFAINPNNPASFAYNRMTVFEAGLASNTTQLSAAGQGSQVNNATSLGYIAFAFPVYKWWGLGLSLTPMSAVGYNVNTQKVVDSIGTVSSTYNGSGGFDKLCLSNGFKLGGFSFGVNTSYLFGHINSTKEVDLPTGYGYFNTESTTSTVVSALYLDYGVQYSFTIDSTLRHHGVRQALHDNWKFVFGVNYANMQDVTIRATTLTTNDVYNGYNILTAEDTIENVNAQKSVMRMPGTWGAGLTVKHGEKLTIGFEYSVTNWSEFNWPGQGEQLLNTQTYKAGFQYTPSTRVELMQHSQPYFKKVFYRAGLRFSTLPVYGPLAGGPQLSEAVLTFGVGLPIGFISPKYNFNILNLGFEIGTRGTQSILQENYFNFVLGLTLNDKWFQRSKYN